MYAGDSSGLGANQHHYRAWYALCNCTMLHEIPTTCWWTCLCICLCRIISVIRTAHLTILALVVSSRLHLYGITRLSTSLLNDLGRQHHLAAIFVLSDRRWSRRQGCCRCYVRERQEVVIGTILFSIRDRKLLIYLFLWTSSASTLCWARERSESHLKITKHLKIRLAAWVVAVSSTRSLFLFFPWLTLQLDFRRK